MAKNRTSAAFPIVESEIANTITKSAWEAAFALYIPIHEQWGREYDAADAMTKKEEQEAAFKQFYEMNLPRFQAARDALLRVPAAGFKELVEKMGIADRADDEHFEQCLEDLRHLVKTA